MNSSNLTMGQLSLLVETDRVSPLCLNTTSSTILSLFGKSSRNMPEAVSSLMIRFGMKTSKSHKEVMILRSMGRNPPTVSKMALLASLWNYFGVTGENSPKVVSPKGTNNTIFLYSWFSLNQRKGTSCRRVLLSRRAVPQSKD